MALEGVSINPLMSIVIVFGIFIFDYLQAALISTEAFRGIHRFDLFRAIAPIAIVGLVSGFAWREWIIEQTLLEAGAFSVMIAVMALVKASQEGSSAPWVVVLIVFVAPAIGIVWLAVAALLHFGAGRESIWPWIGLAIAFGISVWDGWRRMYPFALGTDQLSEPVGGGIATVLVAIWFVALLVGIPWLLA